MTFLPFIGQHEILLLDSGWLDVLSFDKVYNILHVCLCMCVYTCTYVCTYVCCVYVLVCMFVVLFLYLGDTGVSWCTLGGQRTTFRNWLFPSTT